MFHIHCAPNDNKTEKKQKILIEFQTIPDVNDQTDVFWIRGLYVEISQHQMPASQ